MSDTIRELFIEELAEVKGGSTGPLEDLLEMLDQGGASTMACCEEGQCCAGGPVVVGP